MKDEKEVTTTPSNVGEPTVENKTVEQLLAEREAELKAEFSKKETELLAQKEHWRQKYDRDITSVNPVTPEPSEEDVFSDEGKVLKGEISTLKSELKEIKRKEERREVESEFSVLKDKRDEFDAFLEDEENQRLSIKKAAKLFLAEKGYLDSVPERKGLEKPTAGGQTPPDPSKSDEELENLRKTNFRKYVEQLRSGKIK